MKSRAASWSGRAGGFAAGLAATGLLAGALAVAGEPPPISDLPGEPAGSITCEWIAPYVTVIGVGIGAKSGARTVWYSEEGGVRRDVLGGTLCQGFVMCPAKGGGTAVHGTWCDWTISLPAAPPGPPPECFVAASADGRTFVRQQSAADGAASADVFVDGTFEGRVGPFVRWRGQTVTVGDDGSVAVLAAGAPETRGPRVIVCGPRAKASVDCACADAELVEAVAPDGRGVLIRRSAPQGVDPVAPGAGTAAPAPKATRAAGTGGSAGGAESPWIFVSAAGTAALDLGINARVVAWVPGTPRAVVMSGLDEKPRLRLVDLEKGDVVWDVEDQPLGGRRGSPGVAVEGDLVLLSGLEAHAAAGVSHWRRRVDALDLATGARVAVWRSMDAGPVGYAEAPVFQRRRGKLYLVSPDQFAVVPLADIRARTNRWE